MIVFRVWGGDGGSWGGDEETIGVYALKVEADRKLLEVKQNRSLWLVSGIEEIEVIG